jgi:hypothetical protein
VLGGDWEMKYKNRKYGGRGYSVIRVPKSEKPLTEEETLVQEIETKLQDKAEKSFEKTVKERINRERKRTAYLKLKRRRVILRKAAKNRSDNPTGEASKSKS